MFATDTDLLFLEPAIFKDLAYIGRLAMTCTAEVQDGFASLTDFDVTAEDAGIVPGDVVRIGGILLEVVAVNGPAQLVVRAPRVRGDTLATAISAIMSMSAQVVTFRAQRMIAARRMLHHAGVDPDDAAVVARIANTKALADVVAVGALAIVYRTAGALLAEDVPVNQRAREYQRLFDVLRERVPVRFVGGEEGRSVPSRPTRV